MLRTSKLTTAHRVIFALAFLVLFVWPVSAQTGAGPVGNDVEDVYLAKDDGTGQAGEAVTEFRTTAVPIFCVVLLDTTAAVTVKMNFVAVNVAGVKADTKVVSTSFTTKDGQNRVNFTGRPYDKWTPGRYRVDIFLDGRIARNVEFDIKSASAPSPNVAKYIQPSQKPKRPDNWVDVKLKPKKARVR